MIREAELELARRRERALARSAELRTTLALQVRVFAAPLAAVDRVQGAARWLVSNPEWPVGVLVALVVARPRRVLSWGFRLWGGWLAWQRAQRVVARWWRPGSSV